MEMAYEGLAALLRSAVTGQQVPLPEGFSLDQVDRVIKAQSLIPLAYQGAYRCGISKDLPLMKEYQDRYYRAMIKNQQQTAAVKKILQAFQENGIDHMPLKGCNLKAMYPQPELRQMGDADILIRLEQYHLIRPVMEALSYREVKESVYDRCWNGPALYVELHTRLFSENQSDMTGYFGCGWEHAIKGEGFRYDMTPEEEYGYIFCHMTKHFRFCGIGARQIVDLFVYRRARQLDEARVEQIMDELGLLAFYRNIRQLLRVWFEGQPSDPVTDYITDYIFSNGNWGSQENKLYSEELIRARTDIKHSRSRALVSAVFPPVENLRHSYPILSRKPWLYPVYWVVRLFRIFFRRPGKLVKRLKMIGNVTDEKLLAHKNALAYMGLSLDAIIE